VQFLFPSLDKIVGIDLFDWQNGLISISMLLGFLAHVFQETALFY